MNRDHPTQMTVVGNELGGMIYEVEIASGERGNAYAYGDLAVLQCDQHRRAYSRFDAEVVAQMANSSSWLVRPWRL